MSATSEAVVSTSSSFGLIGFGRKRRVIAEAALRVFCKKGVRRAGMRDIAKEAGISVGNLYNYFKNKEELVSFCHDSAIDGLIRAVKEIRASRELDPREKLKSCIIEHVVALNTTDTAAQIHIEMDRYRTKKRNEYERQVLEILEEGVATGAFRKATDTKFALMVILGAVNSTAQWFNPKGPKSARQVGSEFAELLVRGIGAP